MSQPQLAGRRTFTRPALTPRPGSLLDVAPPETVESMWFDLNGLWESLNCTDLNTEYAISCDVGGAPGTKTFDAPTWVEGFRFAAYRGVTCKMVDLAETKALVTEAFLNFESASVESVFGTHVLNDSGLTDLTPAGGAVSVKEGLALLEGHAGAHYAGVPTVHASAQVFSLLDSNGAGITLGTGGYRTKVGSKLVNGGGYFGLDKDTPALTAGEAWLFATGEVQLVRSDKISEEAGAQINQSTNEVFALTERLYVAGYDCYSIAVKVKVLS